MSGARKPILIVIAGPKISSQDKTFYDILPLLFKLQTSKENGSILSSTE